MTYFTMTKKKTVYTKDTRRLSQPSAVFFKRNLEKKLFDFFSRKISAVFFRFSTIREKPKW
jgi:hypothetical protein